MMKPSFWEHLKGLSAAYETLAKEYDDMRSENASMKRMLELHETASEGHRFSLASSEFLWHEHSDADVATEMPAQAVGKTIVSKLLLKQDETKVSSVTDSASPNCDAVSSFAQKLSIDSEPRHCTTTLPLEWAPLSSGKSISLESVQVCNLSVEGEEIEYDNVRLTQHYLETYTDTNESGDKISRTNTMKTDNQSRKSVITFYSSQASQCSSLPSVMESVDLSGISDPKRRWEELVLLVIVYVSRVKYPLLPCWHDNTDLSMRRRQLRNSVAELGKLTQEEDPIVQEWIGLNKKKKSFLRKNSSTGALNVQSNSDSSSNKCILHPLSTIRVFWSLLGLIFVVYDGVMLSLNIFEFEASDALVAIEWNMRIFWMMDILVCFRTGFYVKSRYVDRGGAIARKYAQTWLVVDLVALVPDVFIALMSTGNTGSSHGLVAMLRYVKTIKVLRLVRVAKVCVLFRNFLDSLNSIHIALLLQIFKYCGMLIFWVHLVACIWYAIGKSGDDKDNWITKAGVQNFDLPHTYFISLQWSLSLLQGNSDVFPSFSNAKEGAFSVGAILTSIFILAVFISVITNLLMQLQNAVDEKARHMRALQEYLHRHQVSAEVAESVRKYAAEKLKIEWKLHWGEDDVTACLPKTLRRTLLVEVRGPMVNVKNPVFMAIQRMLPKCFDRICCDLLHPFFVGPDTIVYNFGEDCNQTYFNVAGEIFYEHIHNRVLQECITCFRDVRMSLCMGAENALSQPCMALHSSLTSSFTGEQKGRRTTVAPRTSSDLQVSSRVSATPNVNGRIQDFQLQKDFMRERLQIVSTELSPQPICEAALWTVWKHQGDLHCTSHAGFLILESDSFTLLTERSPGLRNLCACQAVRFCRVLNNGECKISDLTTSNDVLASVRYYGEISSYRRTVFRNSKASKASFGLSLG